MMRIEKHLFDKEIAIDFIFQALANSIEGGVTGNNYFTMGIGKKFQST